MIQARREVAVAIVAASPRRARRRSVLTRPPTTGLASLASVQIAATAMAPAPMKRTCVRQIAPDVRRRSRRPSAAGCSEVRIGTATAHAMSRPDEHRHADREPDQVAGAEQRERPGDVVAAAGPACRARKNPATSPAAMRVAAKMASPAEASGAEITAISPSRASPVSSLRLAARAGARPCSTSAAATPSGYGRSEVVTSARRSGIVNSTPRMPPRTQIRNDARTGTRSTSRRSPARAGRR